MSGIFLTTLTLLYAYYDYQLSNTQQSFGNNVLTLNYKVTELPWATFLVSNGNNIVAYNFARFAANDDKGRQVSTGNGTSCL